MRSDAGLVVEGLSIAFEHGRKEAVSAVSLSVAPGEAVGLVGESGSGKSLTVRSVLGLLPRDVAVGGSTPSPRNESVASKTIACGMSSVP